MSTVFFGFPSVLVATHPLSALVGASPAPVPSAAITAEK
jgi:hypothetical protein